MIYHKTEYFIWSIPDSLFGPPSRRTLFPILFLIFNEFQWSLARTYLGTYSIFQINEKVNPIVIKPCNPHRTHVQSYLITRLTCNRRRFRRKMECGIFLKKITRDSKMGLVSLDFFFKSLRFFFDVYNVYNVYNVLLTWGLMGKWGGGGCPTLSAVGTVIKASKVSID